MTILVGTTMAAYVTDQSDTCVAWLRNAEAIQASHDDVRYFAAFEVDQRGHDPFKGVIRRLEEVGGTYWTFSLDDGRTEVTTGNRVRHITVGQNLCVDEAMTSGCSHLLFLAADLEPPADTLPKLLEMDHPLVGGEVPTYGLHGAPVDRYPFPVHDQMATAAFVLIRHEVWEAGVRWRWDLSTGRTDDPCLHDDAIAICGVPTYVRKDLLGRHWPLFVPAIEHRGHDRSVHR